MKWREKLEAVKEESTELYEEIQGFLSDAFPYRVNVIKGRNKNVVQIEVEAWAHSRGVQSDFATRDIKKLLREYKCQVVNIISNYGKYRQKNATKDHDTMLIEIELGTNTRLQQAKDAWEEVIALDNKRHKMLLEKGWV